MRRAPLYLAAALFLVPLAGFAAQERNVYSVVGVPLAGKCDQTSEYGDIANRTDVDPPVQYLCGITGWVAGGAPSGAAGGDLAGTYPNPTIGADKVALTTDTTGGYAASVSEAGPATTATALAANGANCSTGSFPLGVDAAGAVETCASNVTTATALAANGGNCTVGNYPLGVDASGAVETCTALPAGAGDFVGPGSSTDNAIVRFDGTTGKLGQDSGITVADVSGASVAVATTVGNALAIAATAPAAAAGASQAGKAASLTASAAVASTDTAGAAAGGAVTITSGAAARLTSGNANGGDINLVGGAGIGTGTAGQVLIANGAGSGSVAKPGLAFAADTDTGFYRTNNNEWIYTSGGIDSWKFTGAQIISGVAGGARLTTAASSATVTSLNPSSSDADTGIGWAGADDLRLIAGGVSALGVTTVAVHHLVIVDDFEQAVTCADNATPALASSVTITPTQSYVEFTNADADGCAITLSETGAAKGRKFEVAVVSNAGGVNTLADSSGVQETGAGCSLAIYGSATFRYISDRWIMSACTAVN